MSELRGLRVAQVLKERLSNIFVKEMADRVGFITITDIKVSADLRNATVFYSVLGTDIEKRHTAETLQKATGYINADIGKHLHIKFTPRITFRYDNTPETASRVYEILHQMEEDKIENPEQVSQGFVADKERIEKSGK